MLSLQQPELLDVNEPPVLPARFPPRALVREPALQHHPLRGDIPARTVGLDPVQFDVGTEPTEHRPRRVGSALVNWFTILLQVPLPVATRMQRSAPSFVRSREDSGQNARLEVLGDVLRSYPNPQASKSPNQTDPLARRRKGNT